MNSVPRRVASRLLERWHRPQLCRAARSSHTHLRLLHSHTKLSNLARLSGPCSPRSASTQAVSADNILRSAFEPVPWPSCSVSEYMWQNLERWPDKTAVVCGISGRGFTFSQLYRMSISFAASLRSKLNLVDSDTVAIVLPNMPEYPCALLGILQAGCIASTVNPMYTAHEMKRQLKMIGAKAVVTTKQCYPALSQALAELQVSVPIILTDLDELPTGTIRFAEFAEDFNIDTECLKSVDRKGDDVAVIPFSSGTTGFPKGVQLTHSNLIAANQAIVDEQIVAIDPTTDTHQDVFTAILPFFHIFGMVVVMLNQLYLGCKLVTLPSFQPESFLRSLLKYRTTALFVVPPIAVFMGKHPAVQAQHLANIKSIVCGAAPLAETDVHGLLKKNSKMIIRQGYGLTETASVLTIGRKSEVNYASSGQVVYGSEIKIAHVDSYDALPAGQDGEIWTRGPQVMLGYLDNEEANREVFPEGSKSWYRTGDIGNYDQHGNLYITDRLKELIKVKGFQVPPAELESLLRMHPKVLDSAVIGVPDPVSGEAPLAFVVLQAGQTAHEDELRAFVNGKVVDYKALKAVRFVDSIPKNAAGKILRRELKQKYC